MIVFKENSDSGTYSIFRMKILLPGNIIVSNVCDTHLYLSRENINFIWGWPGVLKDWWCCMSVFYSSEYNKLFLFVATCLVGQPSRMEIFNVS